MGLGVRVLSGEWLGAKVRGEEIGAGICVYWVGVTVGKKGIDRPISNCFLLFLSVDKKRK